MVVNPQRFCCLMVDPITHKIEAVREYAEGDMRARGWFFICRDSDVYVPRTEPAQRNPNRVKHGYGHVEGEADRD
jgi:hypothetical protein